MRWLEIRPPVFQRLSVFYVGSDHAYDGGGGGSMTESLNNVFSPLFTLHCEAVLNGAGDVEWPDEFVKKSPKM
jgi:hypothetical protein